jgi:urea transport system ATP-binding protein
MNAPEPAAHIAPGRGAAATILYLDNVSVSFDGFRALNKLSFYLVPGELRAIIGPNGAGKTTMMDVITGKTRPDEGQVYFDGKIDLTRMDEAAIANLGIGRKFQKPTVFETQSVEDNLRLALKDKRGVYAALFSVTSPAQAKRMDELLQIIGLGDQRRTLAGGLSHGQKQWLEIGMLLAQEPRLLLVDEPAAGMTDAETATTATMLRDIARDRSVVVVEHDMEFVRSLDAKVTVLHEGAVLAEGSMDHVQNDPRVIEVYLGR